MEAVKCGSSERGESVKCVSSGSGGGGGSSGGGGSGQSEAAPTGVDYWRAQQAASDRESNRPVLMTSVCGTGGTSTHLARRRDCHFADTPPPSLLKHLLQGEGGAAE